MHGPDPDPGATALSHTRWSKVRNQHDDGSTRFFPLHSVQWEGVKPVVHVDADFSHHLLCVFQIYGPAMLNHTDLH